MTKSEAERLVEVAEQRAREAERRAAAAEKKVDDITEILKNVGVM